MNTNQKISFCLWVNKNAEEVAVYYTTVFQESSLKPSVINPVDNPSGKSGEVLTANFEIFGQPFMVLNGGPEFTLNPSISFFIHSRSKDEINALWNKLSDRGKVLMELDKYPYSDWYGWIQDQYGLSWQLMLIGPEEADKPRLMPSFLFVNEVNGRAAEAMQFYQTVFRNSHQGEIHPYSGGMEPDQEGNIMYADFTLENQWFAIMESAHNHAFNFNEALSLFVHCQTQEEIDYYWQKLSSDGGKEIQCGWLKDKFGVAWQIAPDNLLEVISGADKDKARKAMQAMMQMIKIDMHEIEKAINQPS